MGDQLASSTEVEVMENYLTSRWQQLAIPSHVWSEEPSVALMRLALMAQGFEQEIVRDFWKLSSEEIDVLIIEMSRTACEEQFKRAPTVVSARPQGLALLLYYAPAMLQKATAKDCGAALRILVKIFQAARL